MAAVSAHVIVAAKPGTLRSRSDMPSAGPAPLRGWSSPHHAAKDGGGKAKMFDKLLYYRQKGAPARGNPMNRLEIPQHRGRLATKRRKGADQAEQQRDGKRDQRRRDRGPTMPDEVQAHHVGDDAPSR